MPKDNIERAIKKAQGGEGEAYEAIRYEGYAPGGVARHRRGFDRQSQPDRAAPVRAVFTKYGGNLAATGAVAHMFQHVGEITFKAAAGSADQVLRSRHRRRVRMTPLPMPPASGHLPVQTASAR